jgi:hypothetical protein
MNQEILIDSWVWDEYYILSIKRREENVYRAFRSKSY